MNNTTKIALSIPQLAMLFLIPYNFFADFDDDRFDVMFSLVLVVNVILIICWVYIVYRLWKDPDKSKATKWAWTLLTILVFQPITTLIYLWLIEHKKEKVD